jgi:alpha-N-acetylglucosaminidase
MLSSLTRKVSSWPCFATWGLLLALSACSSADQSVTRTPDAATPTPDHDASPGSDPDDAGPIHDGGVSSDAGPTMDGGSSGDAGTTMLTVSESALRRILPDHHGSFVLDEQLASASGDMFRIAAHEGRIHVEGTTPAVVLTGVGWYLKYVAHVDLSWPGSSLSRLPATLPLPEEPIEIRAAVAHRFALNDTDDGYSGPYRDWAEWEHTLDLLALHGYNEVLITVGQDAVYQATFAEFGYTLAELAAWIPAPAHQPWWLLQNMCCIGTPMSQQLMDARVALARRIVARLEDLGMTPVFPGYFGTVPNDFASKQAGAPLVPQGSWVGMPRPDWLDTTSELFAQVAGAFYAQQARILGTSTMYKMDLLHEGGRPGNVPIAAAAAGVMDALQAARPGATWVLLGWQENPKVEILDAVDKSQVLIVDGLSDCFADLDREADWNGTPYAFGTIPNFGGHTTLGANATTWETRFPAWRDKPGSKLVGIAYMPEGAGTDPAVFELFSELAWRPEDVELPSWFDLYAARRYGGDDVHARAAWSAVRSTAYALANGKDSDAQDSLFATRPSLRAKTAAMWSPPGMRYDGASLKPALYELLQVAPELRSTDAYRFDLVNVTRQVLTNESRVLLPQIAAAYDARDLTTFRALVAVWKEDMAELDALVATDARFLLGRWLSAARAWATDPAEQDLLETNARLILTLWHPEVGPSDQLRNYANREWAGLVKDFYAMRWNTYFASLDAALSSGGEPLDIDWYALESAWVNAHEAYTTEPVGDPHAVASRIAERLQDVSSARTYEIRVGHRKSCFDAEDGQVESGTKMRSWACNGTVAQRFRAEASSDGHFRLVNVKSNKCLDIAGGSLENGAQLQLWNCNGTIAQDFLMTPASDGTLRILNRKSQKCLQTAGEAAGSDVVQDACDPQASQSFSFH